MKAISGYGEWFWTMGMNIKPVENRGWPLTRYIKRSELPVRIYLHVSKTPAPDDEVAFIRERLTPEERDQFDAVDWNAMRGHIIGEITLVDQVTKSDILMEVTKSPWFFGPYGFVVEDGVLYDKPIPYRGQRGFFDVELTLA